MPLCDAHPQDPVTLLKAPQQIVIGKRQTKSRICCDAENASVSVRNRTASSPARPFENGRT
jgi:hypothetical protein